jgi:hypothetical protein
MKALLQLLRRKAQTVWLGYALAFVFAAAIPVTNHFTEQTCMQRMRFVAMDSRDTFYLSSAGSYETSQHIHAEIAKLAAETIFSRNPDGYDDSERMDRLFGPLMIENLHKDAARDSDIFSSRQIHQKIEIGTIHELNVDAATALVSVEGQILRTGYFNGRMTNDTKNITLFLKLAVNTSMGTNGRYPLVVVDYKY